MRSTRLKTSQNLFLPLLRLFRDRASTAEAPLENERSLVSQTAEKREEIFAYNEELRSVAQMLHSVRSELDVHLLNNSPTFISGAFGAYGGQKGAEFTQRLLSAM